MGFHGDLQWIDFLGFLLSYFGGFVILEFGTLRAPSWSDLHLLLTKASGFSINMMISFTLLHIMLFLALF